jgi:hypothetical protein
LGRVIIMRNDRSTVAIAMPSVLRVTVLASSEIGTARLKANTTSTMPISIVAGMLMSCSTSQRTSRRPDEPVQEPRQDEHLEQQRQPGPTRRGASGGCPYATTAVEQASVKPWAAKRSTSTRTRRWDSMANARSRGSPPPG